MDLRGRGALVTGGSGDLGTAISLALARAGCGVAVAYVGNRRGADQTVTAVQALGCAAAAVQLDQADPAAIDPAVGAAADALGRLNVLVNNAAWNIGIPFTELDRLTVDVWDRMFDTNVRGPFLLARAAAAHMRKQAPAASSISPRSRDYCRRAAPSPMRRASRAHPPDAVSRGGAGTRHHRELRGARPRRGHAAWPRASRPR